MPHAEPGSTTRASVLLLRDGRWREDNLDGVFPADSFDVTVAPLTGDRNNEGAGVHVDPP